MTPRIATRVYILAAIFALGAALRIAPLIGSTFPVNDGGMFLTMAEEIHQQGFALPAFTAYNQAGTPFTYPPLGLYLTALFGWLGVDWFEALRVFPVALSVATVPISYCIGRRLLGEWGPAALAAALFAFSTGSYQWLVMGGGVTRALGLLAALSAIYFAIRMYSERPAWPIIACGVSLGATGLSHPQAFVFAALSVPLLLPFTATVWRQAARRMLMTLAVAALLLAPWLGVTLARHGVQPFVSAAGTGGGTFLGLISLVASRTSGGYLDVLGVATSFALLYCIARRHWLPAVWVLAIAVADSRALQPYLALPAALAVAYFARDLGRAIASQRTRGGHTWQYRSLMPVLAAAVTSAVFIDSGVSQAMAGSPLRSLPPATRSAMAWVGANTEPTARFLVVSGRYWPQDAEAEWFPVLAQRRSLATVQGTEWQGRYTEQVERAGELPTCVVEADRACIERWFEGAGDVDYMFLVDTPPHELGGMECCQQLANQVSSMYDTEVVHREGSVLVVRLTPRSY